jgi:hypothetical protein
VILLVNLLFVSLVIYPILSLFGIFPSFKLKKKLNFGAKIPEGLSYAVNAAISVKSSPRIANWNFGIIT